MSRYANRKSLLIDISRPFHASLRPHRVVRIQLVALEGRLRSYDRARRYSWCEVKTLGWHDYLFETPERL